MGREEVHFASGGESCAGALFLPEHGDAPFPCVVLGTGLSCVRDQGLDGFGERLAAAGFAALAFDYRHFGDSGGEPRQLADAARQREDMRAAIAYARGLPGIDAARVALWGYSLGGGNAQAVALVDAELAAVVCLAPVVSGLRSLLLIGGAGHVARLLAAGVRDAWRGLRGAAPYTVPATGPPGSMGVLNSPDSAPGFAAITPPRSSWRNELCARVALKPPYSLARKVRRIGCPILYCIAEDDDVNPPALGRLAAERAPLGELRTYPGGHFDPFLGENLNRIAADQVEFLRRHLGGAGPGRG